MEETENLSPVALITRNLMIKEMIANHGYHQANIWLNDPAYLRIINALAASLARDGSVLTFLLQHIENKVRV